ncbi:MAG: host-nuclease inhibitor Gam family protein [Bacteroidaceae bacterium]|nr:host-nuclease inhibitor Gam family protein [Bacteroidaceae bacterium]
MGTKRQKKTVVTGVTRDAAEEAFASYAKADARIAKIQAEIELQCAKIREKHQSELTLLTAKRELAFDRLQAYATENQSTLFVKRKSLEMTHGVIGFRTGTPKLKTLKGFTWASALELVKRFLPGYIRQTEEIAKDKLLADRYDEVDFPHSDGSGFVAMPLTTAMGECGIQVVQDETFFVEPKSEDSAS